MVNDKIMVKFLMLQDPTPAWFIPTAKQHDVLTLLKLRKYL